MIFQRSILREKIAVSAVILFTLLTITLVLFLVRGLRAAAVGSIAIEGVLQLMLITTLRFFPLIVVVTVIIAIIVTVSRIYQDSEMAVWQTSGLSGLSLLRPVMFLVIPMFLFLLFMNAILTPWGNQQLANTRNQSGIEELSLMKSGVFRTAQNGQRVFFVDEVVASAQPEFKNVFVLQKRENETLLVVAKRASIENTYDNRAFLVLENGLQYQDKFKENYLQSMRYGRYGFSIDEFTNIKTSDLQTKPVAEVSTMTLWSTPEPKAQSELYRRLSDAIMILPMSMIAVVLGYVRPRGSSRSFGIFLGLVAFMLYLNLIKYGETSVELGRWEFLQALLLVHGTFMILAVLALWYRQNSWRFSPSKLLFRFK